MAAITTSGATVAIDVGGTHTDAVLVTPDGQVFVEKVRSTPADPSVAFMTALQGLIAKAGLGTPGIGSIVHGTTVATNAVIMRKYARVGLITTAGFRDVLQIGTARRTALYDPWVRKPDSLVPPELCVEVEERVAGDGSVVTPLDRESVRRAAEALRDRVDAIAVSLLFSYMHPHHERDVRNILAEALPGIPVTISSEISPEIREYSRTSTTVLNAAVLPETGSYILALEDKLRDAGFACPFLIMTSNGGVVPASVARRIPVTLLVSGPAGGAVGAARIGTAAGFSELVMLDVGGTSADIAFITQGQPQRRYTGDIDGMPVNVPQIDVVPIGAGGGSIASVDPFGALRVGPESAGASPGPASYGGGGPTTVTDAHLVLGNLDGAKFLGGKTPLDPALAQASVKLLADRLGIPEPVAAGAILRIADSKMASALRNVTVSRGVDVRECALVAFGGAGPLHACSIADELGIVSVVVPRYPGLTSALGLILSDGRLDVSNTYIVDLDSIDYAEANATIAAMTRRLEEMLAEWGTAALSHVRLQLDVDVRYDSQAYELTIPMAETALNARSIAALRADFLALHARTYGHSWDDRPIVLTTLRLSAIVPSQRADLKKGDRVAVTTEARTRTGWTAEGVPTLYEVRERADAAPGQVGPLILEQDDSTIVIPPRWVVSDVLPEAVVLRREGTGR